ncbi:hypothetical protein CBM2633_A10049 [Cupriavidus taiwanensis]|uniref:Uncharacterized protein n=2 Tax=Cupriavidus TaxID=106589 RepID=A0A375H2W3_9BURK|nr:hypothetical protein CBM2592_A280051 [Cupriavidus taiwanensis]SPD48418.1 protein of unknown function [Cupriavidus neocaledonicus]SOY52791.1 hypothetical protein CBM2588_A240051 [Cupriavidus taiwanensis]SOY85646.1 hypothetical protein CBM2591_A320050 [Cupriavidus taiwanensis]SOZ58273.1 hypothetical protein CBM2615_A370020 [Cupriavidus taiwanensis]
MVMFIHFHLLSIHLKINDWEKSTSR